MQCNYYLSNPKPKADRQKPARSRKSNTTSHVGFNPPNTGAQSMPVRRRLFPKLTYRDKLRKSLFDLELQLGQARTKAERDHLNQKILDLQTVQREYEAKLAQARPATENVDHHKYIIIPGCMEPYELEPFLGKDIIEFRTRRVWVCFELHNRRSIVAAV
jgi:hypothetical protein